MKKTPYIVVVDKYGCQRLCLSDGTPIPAQAESSLYQNAEQAIQGLCTFNVFVYVVDETTISASTGVKVVDNRTVKMPDGLICEFDYVVRCFRDGIPGAYLTTTARLPPTRHADAT